ncbi:hypothetical protein ACFL39_00165 [Gemmatimonadota bacterium]
MRKYKTSWILAMLLVTGLPLLISMQQSSVQAQPGYNPNGYSPFEIEATIAWPVGADEDPVVTLHVTLTDLGIKLLGFEYFRVGQEHGQKHHALGSLEPDISGTEWTYELTSDPGYSPFMPGNATVSFKVWLYASGSGLGDATVEERLILKPEKP